MIFEDNDVVLEHKETHELVAEGVKVYTNICCLFFKVITGDAYIGSTTLKELHENLGRVNAGRLKDMVRNNVIAGLQEVVKQEFFCEGCAYGKMKKLPHRSRRDDHDSYEVGECIYADLCGPMSTTSLGGNRFFLLEK